MKSFFSSFRVFLASSLLLGSVSGAQAQSIIQDYYVPMPEQQIRTSFATLAPSSSAQIESVISVVVAVAGTRVVYDHWEDGYEINLNAPVQASTQTWGDGNNANGIPPGFVNDPASFDFGTVLALRNLVPLPRNASNILYDGRDRVGATRGIVMSRSGWASPNPGALLADATEVQSTIDWGTAFRIPVGQDLVFPSPATSSMFEYVSVMVMASLNNTQVQIDTDGNGTTDVTTTINQGESYQVHGGVLSNASVTSTKPVQVHVLTGDIGANYESRWFSVSPTVQWTPEYYAPVGTASDGDDTYLFVYNPNAFAIDIEYETRTTSGTFNVPAGTTYRFLAPQNSGTRFTNLLEHPFYAVGAVGAEPTANNVHDWGFALVPTENLTTEAVVGWGPGSEDLTQNGSPVWVTPTAATTIYVDYDGDHAGPFTDPAGDQYDLAISSDLLEVTRVYEPDRDQTGMRLYTLDGTFITAAWGQDPAVAGPARPYLDVGTTIPNFPVPTLIKTSEVIVDNAPAGLSLADRIRYRITLDNRGLVAIGNTIVTDVLPPTLSYVLNSTTHDGNPIPDSGVTAFPLDETGYTIPILPRNSSTVLAFDADIIGAGSIVNTATGAGTSSTNAVVVPPGVTDACTLAFTDSGGSGVSLPTPGDGLYITITDDDANTSAATAQTIGVTVINDTGGDFETITLTETGVNTGVFRNTAALPSSESAGLTPNDGTLNMVLGDVLSATYTDPSYGDTCNDSATASPDTQTKILYLDTDGSDSDATGDMDRVDPAAAPVDGTTSSTSTIAGPVASTVTAGTTTTSSNSSASSLTFSYTPSAGSNRLLLVSVAVGGTSANDTPDNITSVTYGGTGMTLVGNIVSDQTRSALYALSNPAAGPLDVVVTLTGTSSVYAAATTFTGVDISSGLTTAIGSGVTNSAASGNATVTVSSSAGELVFATGSFDEGITNQSITTDAGQTELFNGSGFNFTSAAGSTEPGAAPDVTLGYGRGNAQEWAIVGVAIKPAPGTTGGTVTFTQTPTFCEDFELPAGGTVSAQAYYTDISGSLPASPSVSAVLRKVSGAVIATSNSATTGGGIITFGFPALGAATTVSAGDALRLEITNNQSGVTFQVRYDSSTAPSFVSFDTTTVIRVDSVTVYDDAYPGGAPTVSAANGETLYVRAAVSDPFGASDVTSLPLTIDGPGVAGDISTTLDDPEVVASTSCQKTFEYVWNTGVTTGSYTITATGNEGTEGTVTDSKATSIDLSQLDLGTPCEHELTTGLDGSNTNIYAADEQVCVRVTDIDEDQDTGVIETLSATLTSGAGDVETFTITETGVTTGTFVGCIPASSAVVGTSGNGTLYAPLGTTISGSYTDPDDGLDICTDNAAVPSGSPAITLTKTLLAPSDGIAVVGEAVQFRIRVTNTGNAAAPVVALDDTFPAANLAFVSASPSPDSTGAGTLGWNNVGPLAVGDSIDVIVNFTAVASAAPATNFAEADAGGGVTDDDDADVTITDPSLLVTKTLVSPSPGPAGKGDPVVFSITVENTGDTTIDVLPFEDTFSGGCFDYVSSTLAPDGTGFGSIVWNDITGAGSLAPSGVVSFSITLEAVGACNPATNTASADFVTDENGDPVPPSDDDASVVTEAASISGTVYDDEGAAGFGGDVPLEGVTVTLYTDPNGDGDPSDGVVVGVLQTLVDGTYEFVNLDLGDYVVVETDPVGYSSIDDTEGLAGDNRISVAVATYVAHPGNDFLDDEIDPADFGTISGEVRDDVDRDGDFGDADAGIDGVTIELYTDPNGDGDISDGSLFLSTTTAGGGLWSFVNIPPGDYIVVEVDPSGYYSTADVDGGNDNEIAVTLPVAGNVPGNDFLDTVNCTVDGDCNDGLFCTGTETCVLGVCQAGTDPCAGGPDCADTCNEAADTCFDVAGTACGSSSDTDCDNPDTCDGAGACQVNNEPNTTVCRADAGQCDVAETCDGAGSCPADAFEPNTMACTGASQGGVCDADALDRCTGTSNACVDAFAPNTTVCRADAGQCDVAETCTGSSGSCPADAFEPNTTSCTGASQGGVCDNDAADVCSGTANTCVDAFAPNTTVCRADAGDCDIAETCTGSSGTCPADAFEVAGTSCGSNSDTVCDNPDTCDGSGSCQVNNEPITTECRADAGQCDVAENCDGAGSCPADAFEPNTTSCTGSSQGGVCDNDAGDLCSGTANTCVDAFQPNTVECRADAGECDVAETCTGSSGTCPADAFEVAGTSCGSNSDTVCDNPDTCDGAGACQANNEPITTECRADAGQCDVAENCDGAGSCPADAFEPNTTSCTGASQGGVCDNDAGDLCSGTANTCVDAFAPNTTVCRADAGECDVAETCTGSSGSCPADAFEVSGTACGSNSNTVCDNPDTCNGSGTCLVNNEANGTSCSDLQFCNGADTCTAGICVSAGDPCAPLACDEVGDICLASVDLAVTKVDLSDPVVQGSILVYSIEVENLGPVDATHVTVTDTLDPSTTYQSNTGGCTEALGVLTCNLGTIPNGSSEIFTVTVLVSPAAPTAGVLQVGACDGSEDLCNAVTVAADQPDTNPANDGDDEPTDVEAPAAIGLTLTKSDAPDPVTPGGTLVYTLTYSNTGSSTIANAELFETYDPRTTFVSSVPAPSSGNDTWSLGDLAPGETGVVTITMTVNVGLADGTVLDNIAVLTGDSAPSAIADEPTTVRVTGAGLAALGVTKSVSPTVVPSGALLTWTVTARNTGVATSYDTIVSDTLPAGLTYMNASPTPSLVLGNYVEWEAGDMPPGASQTFVVYAETSTSLPPGALVENCANAGGTDGPGTLPGAGLSAQGCATASMTGAGQDCRLVMTKRGVGIAQPGGEIVYRCLWCDPCVDAPTVVVIDDLPPELEFVSLSSRDIRGYQVLQNGATQQVVLDVGLLPKGHAGLAHIRTRVKDDVAPGTIVNNDIMIQDAAGREVSDTDVMVIGSGVVSDLRGQPTLRVTGSTRAKAGGNVQYMARYSNLPAGSTAMVTLTDTVDPTYVSPAPTTRSTRSMVWKGLSGSGILKVKGKAVMDDPAARGGIVSVEAMVTGPDGSEVVKAGVDTAVLASSGGGSGGGGGGGGGGSGGGTPAGSTGKASLTSPSFVRAGLTATIMLRYTKLVGASKASVTLPEGFEVQSTFPASASIDGNVVDWNGLAATSGILKLTVKIPETVVPGNSLTVAASVTDEAGTVGLQRTMGVR